MKVSKMIITKCENKYECSTASGYYIMSGMHSR